MSSLLIHLFLGMVVSFTGSLPPGVISITVMDTAVRKSFRASLLVAAAASFMEFFQSYVAVLFSKIFLKSEMVSVFIKYGAGPIFLIIGLVFLTKDKLFPGKKEETKKHATTNVAKGLLVGSMNIFVIPFWVFWSTYFASNKWIVLDYASIAIFSFGITIGTFLALFMYARVGLKLASKTSIMAYWGNKTLGIVFIAFAIFQFIKLLK